LFLCVCFFGGRRSFAPPPKNAGRSFYWLLNGAHWGGVAFGAPEPACRPPAIPELPATTDRQTGTGAALEEQEIIAIDQPRSWAWICTDGESPVATGSRCRALPAVSQRKLARWAMGDRCARISAPFTERNNPADASALASSLQGEFPLSPEPNVSPAAHSCTAP
jgi:hypothetical protein